MSIIDAQRLNPYRHRPTIRIRFAAHNGTTAWAQEPTLRNPLHFETFWRATFVNALWFGPFWALIMWLFSWRKDGTNPLVALAAAVICGLIYGLVMAAVFAHSKKKHDLPGWESLGS